MNGQKVPVVEVPGDLIPLTAAELAQVGGGDSTAFNLYEARPLVIGHASRSAH